MRTQSQKMISAHGFLQLICLVTILALTSAQVSSAVRSRTVHKSRGEVTRFKRDDSLANELCGRSGAPKINPERYVHWGPQYFMGWLPIRSRRAEPNNEITTFPSQEQYYPGEMSPEAAAMGESLIDEFIQFLTWKEAGLLDLCLQFK